MLGFKNFLLDEDGDCPDCRGENWIGKLSNKELKEIFG